MEEDFKVKRENFKKDLSDGIQLMDLRRNDDSDRNNIAAHNRKIDNRIKIEKRAIRGIMYLLGAIAIVSGSGKIGKEIENARAKNEAQSIADYKDYIDGSNIEGLVEDELNNSMKYASNGTIKYIENNKETQKEDLQKEIKKEIKDITTKEQILKDTKVTIGVDPEKTIIKPSSQDYIFALEDGNYVTHGNYPDSVSNYLKNNNIKYEYIDSVKMIGIYEADQKDGRLIARLDKNGSKIPAYTQCCNITGRIGVNKIADGNNTDSIGKKQDDILFNSYEFVRAGIDWANNPDSIECKETYIQEKLNYIMENSKNMLASKDDER